MSASPDVIHPQNVTKIAQSWNLMPLVRKDSGKGSSCTRLISGDASSSGDECNTKVRKPYTITKQRERWTESEHQKFLEALKLYGRAWRRIEEYIGTKTAVQIRSHAQKFFSKVEREASTGSSAGKVQDIEIPPPRPKRKPSHPYPKKAGNSPLNLEDENKEPSALSAAGHADVHHEGFQSGSFNPYINQGLGSSSAAFDRSPLVPGHFFRHQGSMKLFGKTVVVPKSLKPGPRDDSSKECLSNGGFPFPNTQTNNIELQQTSGFSPFSKVRNDEIFSEEPSHSDINGSCLVINPSEDPGESHAWNCSNSLPATSKSGAANSHFLSEGEDRQQAGKVNVRNIEHTFSLPQNEGAMLDAQFPQGAQQNQPVHHWMNNVLRYHSGLAHPPMAGHGLIDGVPTNPLTYWQFLQASAVNYAAYTAAMAAAAAAAGWSGLITGHEESVEISRANVNEAQVLSSLGDDVNSTSIPSAVTSWWPFRGFMPSGPSPAMGEVHRGELGDAAGNGHPLEQREEGVALEHNISSQEEEQAMDLGTADEAEMSKFNEDGKKKHTENSPSVKSSCMLGTSDVSDVPVSGCGLPDSESQPEMDATIMPAKCFTQESDNEQRAPIESPQGLYSSSDEFDGHLKKQREGSSSGSNTPISRCQLSECEAPAMLESKKRDSYTLFEDNDDTCSDAFKKPHQLCGITSMESQKIRAKYAEKGRKHLQKDSRQGGSDDPPKRLKSCAHDLELRKEVSQEGRKAFRALFTSKSLPQTFSAPNMVEGRNSYSRNEHVSRPTVSKKESDPVFAPVPKEKARGECINPDESPQAEVIRGVPIHGNFLSTSSATLDVRFGCGVSKEQHEGNSKSFTISSSSGFVPYRRPLCTEAKILEQPSSL